MNPALPDNEHPISEDTYKEPLLKSLLKYSALFGFVGPIIGLVIFSISIALFTLNSDKLSLLASPLAIFTYLFGGIPAVLTGLWCAVLSRIFLDRFMVGFLTVLGGFFSIPLYMVLIELYRFGHFKAPDAMASMMLVLISLVGSFSALFCYLLANRLFNPSNMQ